MPKLTLKSVEDVYVRCWEYTLRRRTSVRTQNEFTNTNLSVMLSAYDNYNYVTGDITISSGRNVSVMKTLRYNDKYYHTAIANLKKNPCAYKFAAYAKAL